MNKERLDEEVIELCNKYKFEQDLLLGNELERKYLLARVSSNLEHEKSQTIILTIVGFFITISLFYAKFFYEINRIIGVIYISSIIGVVTWIFLWAVSKHLQKVKDFSYLKEFLAINSSVESNRVFEDQSGNRYTFKVKVVNTKEKKGFLIRFLQKEAIKESSFKTFISYLNVILSAVKSIVYLLALAAMYLQYSGGPDDEKLAKALLGFLIILGVVEVINVVISVIEEEYSRTAKSILFLVLLFIFYGIGKHWIINYFNSN